MLDLPPSRGRRTSLLLLTLMFVGIGATHFTSTTYFVQIMPPYLPAPEALVYVSGAGEILGGLGLLSTVSRRFARWGLVALLIAVFPANVQMALDFGRWSAFGIPRWALYARLPLQLALIAWVLRATRADEPTFL
jgi:uncharacterized membrane protein